MTYAALALASFRNLKDLLSRGRGGSETNGLTGGTACHRAPEQLSLTGGEGARLAACQSSGDKRSSGTHSGLQSVANTLTSLQKESCLLSLELQGVQRDSC